MYKTSVFVCPKTNEIQVLAVNMMLLPVPSLAPYDPQLHRCTLLSDSLHWSKTRNKVFPPHSLVSLEKKEVLIITCFRDFISYQPITNPWTKSSTKKHVCARLS